MKNFTPTINQNLTENEILQLNSVVLAFVGDSVHTLYVRTKLIADSTAKAGELHILTSKQINAKSQADIIKSIMPMLSENEMGVFKRARNSHSNNTAKNFSVMDYRMATGFEAVLGYLYLMGKSQRIYEIFSAYEQNLAINKDVNVITE